MASMATVMPMHPAAMLKGSPTAANVQYTITPFDSPQMSLTNTISTLVAPSDMATGKKQPSISELIGLSLDGFGLVEARKLMSEEHKALGFRPPPRSLAAEAQAAAAKHPQGSPGVPPLPVDKLKELAKADAMRILAERTPAGALESSRHSTANTNAKSGDAAKRQDTKKNGRGRSRSSVQSKANGSEESKMTKNDGSVKSFSKNGNKKANKKRGPRNVSRREKSAGERSDASGQTVTSPGSDLSDSSSQSGRRSSSSSRSSNESSEDDGPAASGVSGSPKDDNFDAISPNVATMEKGLEIPDEAQREEVPSTATNVEKQAEQPGSPVEAITPTEDLLKDEDISGIVEGDTLSDISDSPTETGPGTMHRMDTGESVEIIGDVYDPPVKGLGNHN